MKNTLAKISSGVVVAYVAFSGFIVKAFAQKKASEWLNMGIDGVDKELDSWIVTMLNWGIGLAALVAVVMLIAAGYLYITAGGDEAKIEKATKTLTFAIIGLVVCFIAVMLVQFVVNNVLK